MNAVEWVLELVLLAALVATAFYAARLERALRILRGDRAAVGELVAGFDNSARTAGQGLERLREAAESAGRQIARHVERAAALKDDLGYLTDRGDRLADRMDALVRAHRAVDGPAGREDLLQADADRGALLGRRTPPPSRPEAARPEMSRPEMARPELTRPDTPSPGPVGPLRSQAERDLLKALGVVR